MKVAWLLLLLATTVHARVIYHPAMTITADGNTDIGSAYGGDIHLELDYTAGSGTISFLCRRGAAAPFIAIATEAANCTADCLRPTAGALPRCHTLRLTMASCSSCNVVVYPMEITE